VHATQTQQKCTFLYGMGVPLDTIFEEPEPKEEAETIDTAKPLCAAAASGPAADTPADQKHSGRVDTPTQRSMDASSEIWTTKDPEASADVRLCRVTSRGQGDRTTEGSPAAPSAEAGRKAHQPPKKATTAATPEETSKASAAREGASMSVASRWWSALRR
jgi:hypothetical protein